MKVFNPLGIFKRYIYSRFVFSQSKLDYLYEPPQMSSGIQ